MANSESTPLKETVKSAASKTTKAAKKTAKAAKKMGNDWPQSIGTTCFGNCALSLTICCLAPIAIYKNAEKVGQPGLPWMFNVMACPCAGAFLRQQIGSYLGVQESIWLGCVLWWCVPCVPLIQEAKNLGTMDEYIAPEMQSMERDARNAS